MPYDDAARRLGVKVIGTVESNLAYGAINYNDPITVGFVQWYGTRACAILDRMRWENPNDWTGVAASIQQDLETVPSDDAGFWTRRYLTQAEGSSLVPVLEANAPIQNSQVVKDFERYKATAISWGMDPDANTNGVLFFFTMYHQGPQYALDVLNAVGPTATMAQLRDGALAHYVFSAYPTRYNDAYNLILAGDSSGIVLPGDDPTEPPAGEEPPKDDTNPEPPQNDATNTSVKSIQARDTVLHVALADGSMLRCFRVADGFWVPSDAPAPAGDGVTEPEPDPTDPPDPEPSGSWRHPLPGSSITSPYGPRSFDGFHYGLDLSTPADGNLVRAVTDLKITRAVNAGDGPYDPSTYVIGHTLDGAHTFCYYHMRAGSLRVSAGDVVTPGQALAVEGATGNVTGRHLHLECYTGNHAYPYYTAFNHIDPLLLLRDKGVNI